MLPHLESVNKLVKFYQVLIIVRAGVTLCARQGHSAVIYCDVVRPSWVTLLMRRMNLTQPRRYSKMDYVGGISRCDTARKTSHRILVGVRVGRLSRSRKLDPFVTPDRGSYFQKVC